MIQKQCQLYMHETVKAENCSADQKHFLQRTANVHVRTIHIEA